jgi:hypothetical protein
VNKAQLREHYRESDHLTPVSKDEPTVFAKADEAPLRLFWDKLAARLLSGEVTQPLWGELAIVVWDLATELDRRDPG